MTGRRALVLGGSGAVGSAVVRELAVRGVPTLFTYRRGGETAAALAEATGATAIPLDLADDDAIRRALGALPHAPDILVTCAGVVPREPWLELPDDAWEEAYRVGPRSAFVATQALAPSMIEAGRGDVVFVGALDRAQSLPLPVAFAAAQGMLSALAMSLAKELSPHGVRVNMVALGPLDAGLSASLDPRVREDYLAFSALRRLGTPAEAAAAIVWLATRNTYMSGEVLPVNGGI